MNRGQEKLRNALIELAQQEEKMLKEEFEQAEPHIFSEEFEKKMADLFEQKERKTRKQSCLKRITSMAAVAVTVCIIGMPVVSGSAGKPLVDIKEWLQKSFTFEMSVNVENTVVEFSVKNLSYIPEGFSVYESEDEYMVDLYFSNEQDGYFSLRVSNMKFLSKQESEKGVQRRDFITSGGYECSEFSYETGVDVYMWSDEIGLFYYLSGNIGEDELVMILEGINY